MSSKRIKIVKSNPKSGFYVPINNSGAVVRERRAQNKGKNTTKIVVVCDFKGKEYGFNQDKDASIKFENGVTLKKKSIKIFGCSCNNRKPRCNECDYCFGKKRGKCIDRRCLGNIKLYKHSDGNIYVNLKLADCGRENIRKCKPKQKDLILPDEDDDAYIVDAYIDDAYDVDDDPLVLSEMDNVNGGSFGDKRGRRDTQTSTESSILDNHGFLPSFNIDSSAPKQKKQKNTRNVTINNDTPWISKINVIGLYPSNGPVAYDDNVSTICLKLLSRLCDHIIPGSIDNFEVFFGAKMSPIVYKCSEKNLFESNNEVYLPKGKGLYDSSHGDGRVTTILCDVPRSNVAGKVDVTVKYKSVEGKLCLAYEYTALDVSKGGMKSKSVSNKVEKQVDFEHENQYYIDINIDEDTCKDEEGHTNTSYSFFNGFLKLLKYKKGDRMSDIPDEMLKEVFKKYHKDGKDRTDIMGYNIPMILMRYKQEPLILRIFALKLVNLHHIDNFNNDYMYWCDYFGCKMVAKWIKENLSCRNLTQSEERKFFTKTVKYVQSKSGLSTLNVFLMITFFVLLPFSTFVNFEINLYAYKLFQLIVYFTIGCTIFANSKIHKYFSIGKKKIYLSNAKGVKNNKMSIEIKQFDKSRPIKDTGEDIEAKIHSSLKHENIIRFFAYNKKKRQLITEHYEVKLKKYLRNGNEQLTSAQILIILKDIAKAMDYIHKNGIIHRGLHPGNIFLKLTKKEKCGFEVSAKIGNFGYSEYETKKAILKDVVIEKFSCYPYFTAKEVMLKMTKESKDSKNVCNGLLPGGVYGKKSEIFSYGRIIDVLINGKDINGKRTFKRNVRGNDESIMGELSSIMNKCCKDDVKERIGSFEIIENLLNKIEPNKRLNTN